MAQPPASRPPVTRAPITQAPSAQRTTTPAQLESMKFLVGLVDTDVPKLPEHLFIARILPILTDTTGAADLGDWLLVAGTLNRPIDVVDGVGNVLFRVPPLQRTVRTISVREERPNYGNLVTHSELMRKNSPQAADMWLRQALDRNLPQGGVDLEPVHQLNEIFKRYNLPLLPVGESPAEEKQAEERKAIFTDDLDDF
jgi:hypothetical protein